MFEKQHSEPQLIKKRVSLQLIMFDGDLVSLQGCFQ
jgi:hypothetical protein